MTATDAGRAPSNSFVGGGPNAEERVARTITVVTAAAALVLGGAAVGGMVEATPYLAPWFTPLAGAIIFGGLGLVAIITFLVPLRGIRLAHGIYAAVFLVVQLAWLPALQEPTPPSVNPWVLEVAALGTTAAVIAWRAWIAWVYVIVNAIIVGVVRYISVGGAVLVEPLQYALLTITLAGVFTALASVALRNAATVDAATAELRETAARSAAATARAREQARLDALVHDEVMSTLFYASRGEGSLMPSIRAQAADALLQLEELRLGRPERSGDVDAAAFVSSIRATVLDASLGIAFSQHGSRSRPIPGAVSDAFAEATAEAVRNSLLHASDARHRAVNVVLSDTSVEVMVQDDGDGFDPRDVAPHRLGIEVSIRGRLAALPGGRASVSSRPGSGTVVALGWSDS
ncbi:sensor histidine kinase [Schumannella luteola]